MDFFKKLQQMTEENAQRARRQVAVKVGDMDISETRSYSHFGRGDGWCREVDTRFTVAFKSSDAGIAAEVVARMLATIPALAQSCYEEVIASRVAKLCGDEGEKPTT